MAKAIHKAANGTKYVYESISYWDKQKQAPRTKQVYLGKLDPESNDLIPKRVAPEKALELCHPAVLTIGPTMLFEHAARESGLAGVLKRVFPKDWKELLTLAYYICHSGSALSHCASWTKDHKVPAETELSSQNISRLLKRIDENAKNQFLAAWASRFPEDEMLCYDITSVSSHAQAMDFVRYGYNRDREKLPQINLAMLYGQQSRMPVYYRHLPGNISDVTTLKKTMQLLDYAGIKRLCFVMDMGFYSQVNIDELYERRYNFLLAAPSGRRWISAIINEQWDTLNSPEAFRQDGDGTLYVASNLEKWNGHRCYVHIFYNEARKAQANDEFMFRLFQYKDNLERKGANFVHQDFYDRFLTVTETPQRGMKVKYDEEAIQKYRQRHSGVFILLSNCIKDPMTALAHYREKDVIEKSFDDLKNEEDCKRLRMHSDRTAEGKLFLGFLALIIRSFIANAVRQNDDLKRIGIPGLLREMNTFREITEKRRYRRIVTEPTRIQQLVMECFGISQTST